MTCDLHLMYMRHTNKEDQWVNYASLSTFDTKHINHELFTSLSIVTRLSDKQKSDFISSKFHAQFSDFSTTKWTLKKSINPAFMELLKIVQISYKNERLTLQKIITNTFVLHLYFPIYSSCTLRRKIADKSLPTQVTWKFAPYALLNAHKNKY